MVTPVASKRIRTVLKRFAEMSSFLRLGLGAPGSFWSWPIALSSHLTAVVAELGESVLSADEEDVSRVDPPQAALLQEELQLGRSDRT